MNLFKEVKLLPSFFLHFHINTFFLTKYVKMSVKLNPKTKITSGNSFISEKPRIEPVLVKNVLFLSFKFVTLTQVFPETWVEMFLKRPDWVGEEDFPPPSCGVWGAQLPLTGFIADRKLILSKWLPAKPRTPETTVLRSAGSKRQVHDTLLWFWFWCREPLDF